MGDRTPLHLVIYACPPDQVDAVLDIIESYGLDEDWGMASLGSPRFTHLTLGQGYCDAEASCGASDEIAGALVEQAPGCAFEVSEDPYADWMGSVNRYLPEAGPWSAECDANGQPQFSGPAVWEFRLLDEHELAKRLGMPWRALLDAMPTKDEAGNPITLPRADREG